MVRVWRFLEKLKRVPRWSSHPIPGAGGQANQLGFSSLQSILGKGGQCPTYVHTACRKTFESWMSESQTTEFLFFHEGCKKGILSSFISVLVRYPWPTHGSLGMECIQTKSNWKKKQSENVPVTASFQPEGTWWASCHHGVKDCLLEYKIFDS